MNMQANAHQIVISGGYLVVDEIGIPQCAETRVVPVPDCSIGIGRDTPLNSELFRPPAWRFLSS
jgi:hypothetical protein